MKKISLSRGHFALVDDEDFETLSAFKWTSQYSSGTFYAIRKKRVDGKSVKIYMHREIMVDHTALFIDHKDRNGLNNQRSNLRACTSQQNNANRAPRGVSNYKGVCHTEIRRVNQSGEIKVYPYWQASIQIDGKSKIIGRFKSEDEAALAYNRAAEAKYGEFANLNVVANVAIAEYDADVRSVIVK